MGLDVTALSAQVSAYPKLYYEFWPRREELSFVATSASEWTGRATAASPRSEPARCPDRVET
jgi:hypothetical protein